MRALAVCALILVGCIHLGRPHPPTNMRAALAPPNPVLCGKLQSRALWFSLSAIGAGGIGSASTALSGDVQSPTAAHWSLVGIGAGMSILGGVFGYLGTWFAAEFTHRGCQ